MRTQLNLSLALALLAGINHAAAQQPVITSFSQNGVLVCTNLQPGTVASMEWTSSLAGPWQTNWSGLDMVTVGTNGSIQVGVPMYYRVRGVAYMPPPPSGMVLIPAASFTMGNSTGDADITDAAPVTADVSAFCMDTNLVSWSHWQGVYAYATNHGYGFVNGGDGKAGNHPVQTVDWYDCVKWCNARSEQAGKVPVYYTDAGFTKVYTNGEVTVYVNWGAKGYRLPTEAEWEKAARGGLSGHRFPWGNTISWSQANYYVYRPGATNYYAYDANATSGYNPAWTNRGEPYTTAVGSFAANGYGLYGMAGNVFQWCWDWYATPYAGGPDPRGVATGSYRVLRGGGWDYAAYGCRSAYRDYFNPSSSYIYIGFRSVLLPGQ